MEINDYYSKQIVHLNCPSVSRFPFIDIHELTENLKNCGFDNITLNSSTQLVRIDCLKKEYEVPIGTIFPVDLCPEVVKYTLVDPPFNNFRLSLKEEQDYLRAEIYVSGKNNEGKDLLLRTEVVKKTLDRLVDEKIALATQKSA